MAAWRTSGSSSTTTRFGRARRAIGITRARSEILPDLRALIFAGKYAEADQLAKQMQGSYGQSYLPLGDLRLMFDHSALPDTYRRWLDLDSAVAGVRYTFGGATFTREAFASAPDQAIVVRLTCDQPGLISFTAALDSQLRHTVATSATQLDLIGRAPRHVAPSYYQSREPIIYDEGQDGDGMRFAACLHAIVTGGHVRVTDDGLRVQGADSVTLYLAAATSFGGYNQSPGRTQIDPFAVAREQLDTAVAQPYAQLRQAHVGRSPALIPARCARPGPNCCGYSADRRACARVPKRR